jgi:hypothetical protein
LTTAKITTSDDTSTGTAVLTSFSGESGSARRGDRPAFSRPAEKPP